MQKNETRFGIVYECLEAISNDGKIMTKEGDKCVVSDGDWGLTGSALSYGFRDAATWETYEEAEKIAKKWDGMPWYHKTNGNYVIVELQPAYVQSGWKLKE